MSKNYARVVLFSDDVFIEDPHGRLAGGNCEFSLPAIDIPASEAKFAKLASEILGVEVVVAENSNLTDEEFFSLDELWNKFDWLVPAQA